MMKTIRMTAGQALVRFLDKLQTSRGIPNFGCEFRYRDPAGGALNGPDMAIDYAMLARACDCDAFVATTASEFRQALAEARNGTRTALIEVKTVKKSMSEGYEAWWRVGIPDVSAKPEVVQAYREQLEEIRKARAF